ncbi:hypothetical protein WUBG_07295 [Wuchereria bancrofti]|uniref:Uncharacterized protein n=1 Tax=Wuchereria bancrofti TaxID=6293 RepID=J9EX90_WUCBA|nr:hypothetical protein WUBG_07295 [Wuchereria bancrofti]
MIQNYRKWDALNELHIAIRANKPGLVLYTLQRHRSLNINSNLMRTSALSLAVRNQSEPIVLNFLITVIITKRIQRFTKVLNVIRADFKKF